ncbi:hypothetical protein ACP70R_048008 [Stipagrostis hirtigluma subsp. patula]
MHVASSQVPGRRALAAGPPGRGGSDYRRVSRGALVVGFIYFRRRPRRQRAFHRRRCAPSTTIHLVVNRRWLHQRSSPIRSWTCI